MVSRQVVSQMGLWRLAAYRYIKNISVANRRQGVVFHIGVWKLARCEMSRMVGVNSLKRGVRLWAGLIRLRDSGQLADSCENDEIMGPMKGIESRQFFE
jgi:hypothetical protein